MIIRELRRGVKVILVDDVSPEDVAMVQALYSRSAESAEVHLRRIYDERREHLREALTAISSSDGPELDERVDVAHDAMAGRGASARAGKFMRSYYVGYGHKSIADCAATTVFVEGVSMLCAKAIQATPLYCGQETSTRYLDMASRPVVDPAACPENQRVVGDWLDFYARGMSRARDEVRRRHPRLQGESEDAYERAVGARAFDVMRGFLPAGTTTQLSWTTNLRQAADHLSWLLHHPLSEVRDVASAILDALQGAYPSSFSRLSGTGLSGIAVGDGSEAERERWLAGTSHEHAYVDPRLPGGAGWGESTWSFATTVSNSDLEAYRDVLQSRPRGMVLPHWMSDLGQCTFRFDLDFGSFRDVQRHRNGVCRMPLLTTERGFEAWYLDQLSEGHREEAERLISRQTALVESEIAGRVGTIEAQNYVAMGFRVPCRLTYGLPAAVYVMELRSGRTIHPTLRARVLEMIGEFRSAHPTVTLHVDESPSDWDVRRGGHVIVRRDGQ